MISLLSVSIEPLWHWRSCCSDDSSLHQLLTLLSAQSQDGLDHEGMPNSLVTTRRCRRVCDWSSTWETARCWRRQSHSRLGSRYRLWGVRNQEWASWSRIERENSNVEHANMEIPWAGTFHQRMMPCNIMQRIQWVHWEEGPEIMACGSRICTSSWDSVPKQPSCSSESKD